MEKEWAPRSSHTGVWTSLKEAELCELLMANLALPSPVSIDREFLAKTLKSYGEQGAVLGHRGGGSPLSQQEGKAWPFPLLV